MKPTQVLGPWFAHRNFVTDKENFEIAKDGSRLGDTPNWWIDADSKEAARLIAAAPELLAALKHLLPIAARAFGVLTTDLDTARAAIAKAEGWK